MTCLNRKIDSLTKEELNTLINQMQEGSAAVVASGNLNKLVKLNRLTAKLIDLYTFKFNKEAYAFLNS